MVKQQRTIPAKPIRVYREAIAKVDKIKDEAYKLGWSRDKLYSILGRHRFPCGKGWGLVCFMEGRDIVEVTKNYIKLVNPESGVTTRFRKDIEPTKKEPS